MAKEYSSLIQAVEAQQTVGNLQKQANEDPIARRKDEARGKLYNIAWNALPGVGRPANASDLTAEQVNNGLTLYTMQNNEIAGQSLAGEGLESLIKEIPGDKLERLAGLEAIGRKMEDKKMATLTHEYLGSKAFLDAYNSGRIDEEGAKAVAQAAAEAFAKEEVGKYKGFSKQLQDTVRAVATNAMLSGGTPDQIRKYAMPGIKARVDNAKKALEAYTSGKGMDVYDGIRAAIKKLADKGSTDERVGLLNAIYKVDKGIPLSNN